MTATERSRTFKAAQKAKGLVARSKRVAFAADAIRHMTGDVCRQRAKPW
jgi:hypothetical protein